MSGNVQFNGSVPFVDRRTGARVEVRVWGSFVGHGVDKNEEQAVREWIINAFCTSAASYDGDIAALAHMGQEWGAYVSQQISPQLAKHFNAHGTVNVEGVQPQAPASAPMKSPMAAPMMGAPMMGAPMMGADPILEAAAQALSQRMGASIDQAREVAAIVLEVVRAHGGMAKDVPAYGKDPNAYAPQQAAYQKDQGGYQKDQGGYGKDQGGYAPQQGGQAKDPYGKDQSAGQWQDQKGQGKDQGYQQDPYGKEPPKNDPWKK